jgi:hypothetical protein
MIPDSINTNFTKKLLQNIIIFYDSDRHIESMY